MGSLPNLHELGREGPSSPYRPGPALGHLCGGMQPTLSQSEKSKILHRYSGHARITKARSNGHDSKIVYDDFMLEHMAAYSPISNRSSRNLPHAVRRRDSLNSSIGATSVRRLLAVVRPSAARAPPPPPSRRLLSHAAALCVCHLLATAALLPFLALQASVSVWGGGGALLLALAHAAAAPAAALGPALVRRVGADAVLLGAHVALAAVYAAHVWPSPFLLVPMNILLGLVLGPLASAQITILMTLSLKIGYMFSEEDEDSKAVRRTCVIRRLARAFQAAHDFGLILGSVLSALLITYTVNISNQEVSELYGNATAMAARNHSEGGCGNVTVEANCTRYKQPFAPYAVYDYAAFLDEMFEGGEGARLCGAQACPPAAAAAAEPLPRRAAVALAAAFASLCAGAAAAAAAGPERACRGPDAAALRAVADSFGDARLRMAAPLALFIGMEQAFMYADFGKSYVVCTLGIHRLNLIFLSMGVLQSIAACTLSMLLRSIRRYYVVAVGFTFHACLLMVLILWKPIEDDPALFYVISAAWGVCNAIWEMLNFTLLTGLYSDNWEPAFANSAFFRFLGLSIAFAFHGLLCNYYKLYALGFFLVAAVVPFVWLEIRLENMRKVKNIIRL